MSDGEPADGRGDPADVPRLLLPLVWVAGVVWLVLRAAGRGFGTLHDWYVRGWAALGRACLSAGRTVLTWLGPLGHALLRLARPLARAVKRAWDRLGLRAVLFLFRPLGRWARRLAAATHRGADWVVQQAGRLAARAEPLLRVSRALTAAVGRTAASIAAFARRCWAPVARFTARISRTEVSRAGRAPARASEPGP